MFFSRQPRLWIRKRDSQPTQFSCIHVYVFFSYVLTYSVMLQAFIWYCSYARCLWCMCVCVCVCVAVVFHWHCSAQLSMFKMEKRYRNKIIIIIITDCRFYQQCPGNRREHILCHIWQGLSLNNRTLVTLNWISSHCHGGGNYKADRLPSLGSK